MAKIIAVRKKSYRKVKVHLATKDYSFIDKFCEAHGLEVGLGYRNWFAFFLSEYKSEGADCRRR